MRNSYNSIVKNQISPLKYAQNNLNRHFFQRTHTHGQQNMKKCLTSLVIKEKQIKTQISHLNFRMAIIKRQEITNAA